MLIGELAKLTGVSKDTIRLYERKGFIKSQPVAAGSRLYKDYPNETLEIIKNIRQARLFGASLKEWKAFNDGWSNPYATKAQRHALLSGELKKVQERLKQLRHFERILLEKMQQYKP